MKSQVLFSLFAALMVLFSAAVAHAQDIVFGDATEMVNANPDISLAGDYLDAVGNLGYNDTTTAGSSVTVTIPGAGNTTLGTVDFNHINYNTGTDPSGDIVFTNVTFGGGDLYVAPSTANQNIDSDYFAATLGVVYDSAQNGTVTLNNLTPGDLYEVEVWKARGVDGGTGSDENDPFRQTEYDSSNTVRLDSADYVIGTFIAPTAGAGDTSSEYFTFGPDLSSQNTTVGEVSAVMVRDLGVAPEPSTWAMLASGLVGLFAWGRMRRVRS